METTQAILSRRSVRKFNPDKPIHSQTLSHILRCGLSAPSSKNAQPWRFHVVTDRKQLLKVASLMLNKHEKEEYGPTDPKTGRLLPGYTCTVIPSARILKQVPAAIFIENLGEFVGNRQRVIKSKFRKESLVSYEFELLGIGAAIENVFLAAHSKKIGAVFMGDVLFVEDAVREMLTIPGDLLGVIALGYRRDFKNTKKKMKRNRVVYH